MKKCSSCGTELKTTSSSKPSRGNPGHARAGSGKSASPQKSPVQVTPGDELTKTHYDGQSQAFVERLRPLTNKVNRDDVPAQLNCGGPVVLNKGEHIFSIYPRRVDQGRTIRVNEETKAK